MTTKTTARALGPYVAFKVEPEARELTGFAAGVRSEHPSETARAIALFNGDEWGDDAAMEHAVMFAASLDLLETLRGILTYVEDGNVVELRPCGFVEEVRAAIDRATRPE